MPTSTGEILHPGNDMGLNLLSAVGVHLLLLQGPFFNLLQRQKMYQG